MVWWGPLRGSGAPQNGEEDDGFRAWRHGWPQYADWMDLDMCSSSCAGGGCYVLLAFVALTLAFLLGMASGCKLR